MELFKIHFNKPDNSKTVVKYYMYVLKQIVYNHARVNILNSASRILQCWSYYVKINSGRHQHDTKRTQKQSGIVAIDSCFALFGVRQQGETTRENSGEKYPRTLI